MKTGLTKKQKVTEVFYNAKDPTAEIYTHDSKLKKRLMAFAEEYPELCRQTDMTVRVGCGSRLQRSESVYA